MSKCLKFSRKIKGRKVKLTERLWSYPFGELDEDFDVDIIEELKEKKIGESKIHRQI